MLSQQAGIVYVASNAVRSACVHTSPDPDASWLCYHESLMRREACLKGAWVDLFSNRMLSAAETSERQPFFKIRVFPCPRLRKDPTQLPATPLTEPAACSEHAAPESLHTLPVPRLLPHLGLTSGSRSISEGSIPEQRLSF